MTGQLVPIKGLATVMAPATGVVSRLDVSEGQRVTTGQMLAVVTVPHAAYLIFPEYLEIAILRRINSG